jgi:hydrogenase-4 component E
MIDFFVAFILITGIMMSGFRRAKLLNFGYAFQSLLIALVCLAEGIKYGEYHYYILFFLTLVIKVFVVPVIIDKSIKGLKKKREMDLIINGFWSYIISGTSVVLTFLFLAHFSNELIKTGVVLLIVGAILLIGRKKAVTQMIGLLTLENGIVVFEIATVNMGTIIELGIIFEVLVLAIIMGMMIFRINKTFDSVNTDYLSNLKE